MIEYFSAVILTFFFAALHDLSENTKTVFNKKNFLSISPSKESSSVFLILTILPLWLLGIFRSGIGTDYSLYQEEFYNVFHGGEPHYDIGFTFLNKIAIALGLGYQFVVATSFSIFLFGVFFFANNFCKKSILFFSLLLFFSYNYFISFSLIAQYAAIGVLFIAFVEVFKNRKAFSLLLIIFASLLHSSAIFFLVFWLLAILYYNSTEQRKRKLFMLCTAASLIFTVIGGPLIIFIVQKTRFAGYLTDASYSGLSSLSFIVINISVLIFEILVMLRHKDLFTDNIIPVLVCIQMLAVAFSLLQGQVTLLFRYVYYLSVFIPVSLPMLTSSIRNRRILLATRFVIVICFIIWWLKFPMQNDYYHVLPYTSILS